MTTKELRDIATDIKEDRHFSPQRVAEVLEDAADLIDSFRDLDGKEHYNPLSNDQFINRM